MAGHLRPGVCVLEQFKTKKVLVQHVETISSYEATIDVVQSFVVSMAVSVLVP